MQMTIDGFVASPNGELDWATWNWDDKIKNYVNELTDSVDTILLGRKLADGFIPYWTNVKSDDPQYPFAKRMVDIPKVVFTKTLEKYNWVNTTLAKDNLVEEVKQQKNKNGNGIIVYGGASFVSSLIKNNLIDEYHLFINPVAIGKGLTIFNGLENKLDLKLVNSKTFDCGIVVNHLEPKSL